MSQTSPEAASHSNYQVIFDSALEVYKKKTGKDLASHPLLGSFETCRSPDAVLAVLHAQIYGPGQPQSSGDKLLAQLNPTINVLNAFSGTIGGVVSSVSFTGLRRLARDLQPDLCFEAYPPVGVIFTGIGILLSVSLRISFSQAKSRAIVTSYFRLLAQLAPVEISFLTSSSA
jgi:hypothetical protein